MRKILPLLILISLVSAVVYADDIEESRRKAVRELAENARSGNPKSLFDLARLHEYGYDSIPRDSLRSFALYLESAEKGYGPARNYVGFSYYLGQGVRQDIDSAFYWVRLAADEGDMTAASNLGYMLSQGDSLRRDYPEAIKWLEKAAEASVPAALSQLGDFKRQGLACEKDTIAAVSLYEKAAEGGDYDAQLKLLAMMGFKWRELPTDSALNLGMKYYLGALPIAGVELLERASAEGEPKALALMGDAYSRGIGVEYDYGKAIEYFHRAAEAGNPSAQFILAEMLEFFPDSFPDHEAEYWYSKAAEAGVTDSDTAYGLLLNTQ